MSVADVLVCPMSSVAAVVIWGAGKLGRSKVYTVICVQLTVRGKLAVPRHGLTTAGGIAIIFSLKIFIHHKMVEMANNKQ